MTFNLKTVLAGASVLAVLAAAPAFAETRVGTTAEVEAQPGSIEQTTNNRGPEVTKDDIKRGWENTKDSVSKTSKKVANAVEEKYEDVKAVLIGGDQKGTTFDHHSYKTAYTAKTILGRPVKDSTGKDVAKIHDIILDKDGNAKMVVLSDGGFFGIGGKMISMDYASVIKSNTESEILMPVSKESIANVGEFSYKANANGNAHVMPADGVSLREAMDANVVNPEDKKIASVDNVTFSNGKAQKLIVGFDKTLGLGGDMAALDFNDAKLLRKGESKISFQLSANQSASFENYKKSVANN